MTGQRTLIGIFSSLDDMLHAIEAAKRARVKVDTVYSPTPCHELAEILDAKPSPVRFFTLMGGIMGLALGMSLAVYTALQWEFIVGGRPVVAWIPFMIVGFEFTILLGIGGNLIGMLMKSRIPRTKLPDHYDPRFTKDRFGVSIECPVGEAPRVSQLLKEAGAEEVHEVDG
ncbi:MAG: DUF3341 domain-containing protein [Proteobacteria bacterium]|nr:DUF3341 domain-containing protein [Pseudomonadota bacterium]